MPLLRHTICWATSGFEPLFIARRWEISSRQPSPYGLFNQYLYQWHVTRTLFPNERLTAEQKKPVGYFVFHGGRWLFVNQTLTGLKDVTTGEGTHHPPGSQVILENDQKLLLSPEDGGRLVHVQMANI